MKEIRLILGKFWAIPLALNLGTVAAMAEEPVESEAVQKTKATEAEKDGESTPDSQSNVIASGDDTTTSVRPTQNDNLTTELSKERDNVEAAAKLAGAKNDQLLNETYQALLARLQQAIDLVESTFALEKRVKEQDQALLDLIEKKEKATGLIEQTAARRARALGRLKELGLPVVEAPVNEEPKQ